MELLTKGILRLEDDLHCILCGSKEDIDYLFTRCLAAKQLGNNFAIMMGISCFPMVYLEREEF